MLRYALHDVLLQLGATQKAQLRSYTSRSTPRREVSRLYIVLEATLQAVLLDFAVEGFGADAELAGGFHFVAAGFLQYRSDLALF
jgi:hypothetical protein